MREPENYLNYNLLSYSGQEIDIQLFYKYHLEQDVEIKGRVTVLYYKWPTFTVKNRL